MLHQYITVPILFFSCVLSGCVSPPSRVDVSQRMPAEKSDLVGTWYAYEQTADDPWRFPEAMGLTIREDNSGEMVSSAVFQTGRGRHYHIYKQDLRVEEAPDGGWQLDFLTDPETLEGDGTTGWGYTRAKDVPLILTQRGLVLDMDWKNHVYFTRTNRQPVSAYPHISEHTEKQRKIIMGATYPGKALPGQGGAGNDQQMHTLASALQMGAGLAAMGDGNYTGAQQAFSAAQRQSMAGLQGREFDTRQAGEDAFRTGAALGSDGASVEARNRLDAVDGTGYASGQSAGAGASGNASSHAVSEVAEVEVDSMMITAYTDGYAYDLLTLLPQPGSAGEYTFLYGQTKDNAKSILENGYQAAGQNSTYGKGNPRQQISYRRYPIHEGQKIKYGIEVKAGQFVHKPADYTSYGAVPLR